MEDLALLADRLRVGRPLSFLNGLVRRALVPAERLRQGALTRDHADSAAAWTRLAQGAPAGARNRRALIISSIGTVWGWKLEGLLSLVARLVGCEPWMVELGYDPWVRRYHRLFAEPRHTSFRGYRAHVPTVAPRAGAPGDSLDGIERVSQLLHLQEREVDIGRIALSNHLNRNKFTSFKLALPDTRAAVTAELGRVAVNLRAAERLVEELRPTLVLVLEKGLSPAAELVGVCLARGIPVVQYVGAQTAHSWVFKRYRYEIRHQHPFSLDASSWETVKRWPWSEAHERSVLDALRQAYVQGTWFDRKFLHEGKHIKAAAEVKRQLDLDPDRKTATVFSHVLWDATFFYGEGLFEDYETWLLETLKAACANTRLNWVIKLHPDLVWKLRYEGYEGELRDLVLMRGAVGALPPHVKIVLPDTDISTYSFFEISDYCLTVRGTIGIEMACHGVPVLTAGSGRYSGLGFTTDSSSAGDYLQRLAHLEQHPSPTPRETELARRFADALFRHRPWRARCFDLVKQPLGRTGDPLDTNLLPRAASYAEFSSSDDVQKLADFLAGDQADYLEGRP